MGFIPFLHTSIPAALRAEHVVPEKNKSVTYVVSTKCYPCGEHVRVRALPKSASIQFEMR